MTNPRNWNLWESGGFEGDDQSAETPRSHPDRDIQAEEAIEASFHALATRAELMGWTRNEAAFALLNLAAARVLTMEANRFTEDAIARAVEQVEGCA